MSIYTEAVTELVAIGAAVASNCEACLKYHYRRAQELGVSHEDLAAAIATAQKVKATPAQHIDALAARLGGQPSETPEASIESCCAAATAKKTCCG